MINSVIVVIDVVIVVLVVVITLGIYTIKLVIQFFFSVLFQGFVYLVTPLVFISLVAGLIVYMKWTQRILTFLREQTLATL